MIPPELARAIADERLPAAVVDLDAFDRNVARFVALAERGDVTLRVASKSLRVPSLLERALRLGAPRVSGILAYAVREAEALHARGLDDLLVAYPPSVRRGEDQDLARAARLAARGATLALTVDARETIDRAREEARRAETTLRLVLCVDVSLELGGGRIHLGVRRSPLREPDEIVALARHVASRGGLSFEGLLAYEAQIAGLPDRNPYARLGNPAKELIRRASVGAVARQRRRIVRALEAAGLAPRLVNGGGTGSLDTTTRASGVTEASAGSGLVKPLLFDCFHDAHVRALEPALFFALEVTRLPGPGWATVSGGGYVASGAAGPDKLPRPIWPSGLSLEPMEGAGEVQTPLRLPPGVTLGLGDSVLFRHAKAGELAERFDEVLLVRDGRVVDRAPTYRGLGWSFF